MTVTLGIVLNETNAIRAKPDPRVGLVLLERTFYDPPRRAAMVRWAKLVERSFPNAALVPYAWHLVSHGPGDQTREHVTRTLSGEPGKFGLLQDTHETQQAWEVTAICLDVCGSDMVAVRTPPSLTPGVLGRRRLQHFAEARAAEGRKVIWEPSGLWEAEDALAFGRQIGAKVLLPAFEGGRPRYAEEGGITLLGPDAWLLATSVGSRRTLSGDQVDALADHASENHNAVMVFSGRRALAAVGSIVDALD